MAVGRLLSLVRRRGTHCQNVYVIPLLVLLFLAIFSKHSFSQSTTVSSALEALAMMRYIHLRFTLHYIIRTTEWLDSLVIRALDSRLNGRKFDSRPSWLVLG